MTKPPKDRYNAVWLIFFMLGLGTLLPWNFFMTATMYFTSRLAEDGVLATVWEEDARHGMPPAFTDADNNPGTSPSITLSGPTVTSMPEEQYDNVSSVMIPQQTYLQSKFNNVMTLCAMLPLLAFTCLNSVLHSKIPQNIRIAGSLVAIFLVFLLTAIFVKISFSPVTFFTLTMLKIVFINCGSALEDSAFGYFITACVVILLALLAYLTLNKLEFYQFYTSENLANAAGPQLEMKKDLLTKDDNTAEAGDKGSKPPKPSILSILKKMWVMALSVCLVFTVTIGIFPSVTADVKSTIAGDSTWSIYFIPVSCFLLFNAFDWAGRSLTAVCLWPGKDSKLLPVMVAARLLFLPLFMLCNVSPRTYLPVYFAHDAWYICFMVIFALSNGYLASLCMCFGPKMVDAHEAETAGAIMAFFLSLGLALGAGVSFLLRVLV
uniref:Solute carrier family 29 member 1 (Augustine blood group) n=1 Tax=Leptobrachium leishanense TaxID=445787 RepID=A0A8C5N0G0_9ANUR